MRRRLVILGAPLAATLRPAFSQTATPFAHGVASGDPLTNRVMLWTRVEPSAADADGLVAVDWIVAEDPAMRRVYQAGRAFTNALFDYTVKVDVPRLRAGTTYYYQFNYRGTSSPVGRTKTLPIGPLNRLRLGVVSCSNYPYGYFNAYRHLARRADLDAVLHLGDYIYEYANRVYGDGTRLNRVPAPDRETVTLADYRTRYAQYRSDADLQEVHRQHPFIAVWDDHESANDAHLDGAENHKPETQGDWYQRKAVAAQAYLEWMPVRENAYEDGQIFRSFRFGDLADLIMLDSRNAGRARQVAISDVAGQISAGRSLLGGEQESWLFHKLGTSQARGARWRLLGQQTMMSQLVGPDGPFNTDQWDGYVASRNRFLGFLGANAINNTVVLTGDIHSSWGNEIAANPFAPGPGAVRQAVEFVTPAVSSPGIDDLPQATALQAQITATHPHVKFVDLFRRGYLLLDLDRDRAQGEWYHVASITERTAGESFARALRANASEPALVNVAQPSAPPAGAAAPAP